MRRPHPPRGARAGFSLPELLVVATLGILLVLALQQALLGQRRFVTGQTALAQRQETLAMAGAGLGAAFREVELAQGDAVILAPDRVRVRMPYGLASVCGIDNNGGRVGVIPLEGVWNAGVGDSVKVLLAGGVGADAIGRIDPPSNRVGCVASGVGLILRLDNRVPDIVQASPARAFRSHLFEAGSIGSERWLFRVDGAMREVVAGPLDGAAGFTAWYEDARGTVVPTLAGAERIALRVVARTRPLPGRAATADTLTLRFGGRNR